ncbi:MAG: hypothetical protein HOW97_02430 [Catenulispora sp.]|nr:hypothetical protein [Catenulispora sp.]
MTDYRTKAEKDAAERFPRETANHQMTILHDDGLYRHLRFAQPKPASSSYWFDLITWPGSLTIRGDLGESYTFSRLPDMFEFFRGPVGQINAHYWSEKLDNHRDSAKEYSEEAFANVVWTYVRECGEGRRGLAKAIQQEIFDPGFCCDEQTARDALEGFEYQGFKIHDVWELSFHNYKWTFLWACHAIVWGIAQYDAAKTPAKAVA